MARISATQVHAAVAQLSALTGDELSANEHASFGGWELKRHLGADRSIDHRAQIAPYGLPAVRTSAVQFLAHLRQATWAAQQLAYLTIPSANA